jgi:hypothetical protein
VWTIGPRYRAELHVGNVVAEVSRCVGNWGWWIRRSGKQIAMGRASSRSAAKLYAGKIVKALAC